MPTIRPASNTSRKTMINAASTDAPISLDDQGTPGLLVEIVHKLVSTWRKRANVDDAFAAGSNHLLDPERHTLEFHWGGIKILHPQDERPIGRRTDFGGLKMMALNRDRNRIRLLRVWAGTEGQHRCHKHQYACERVEDCECHSHGWFHLTSIKRQDSDVRHDMSG